MKSNAVHFSSRVYALVLFSMAALFIQVAHADTRYAITAIEIEELGTLGGSESVAYDINDNGDVTGWSTVSAGYRHAFLYRGGLMMDLFPADSINSEGRGLNIYQEVVGFKTSPGVFAYHTFYWYRGRGTTLIEADPTATVPCAPVATAAAIANSGYIVGTIFYGCDPLVASVGRPAMWPAAWSDYTNLEDPFWDPHPLDATDINEYSEVTIDAHNLFLGSRLFSRHALRLVPAPALPPPGWANPDSVRLRGLNDAGAVVGDVDFLPDAGNPATHRGRGAIYSSPSRVTTFLAEYPYARDSVAVEINNQDFAVGTTQRPYPDKSYHSLAVMWHPSLGIVALPFPAGVGLDEWDKIGHDYCEATSVNNRNIQSGRVQVVGFCSTRGRRGAVRWNITTVMVSAG